MAERQISAARRRVRLCGAILTLGRYGGYLAVDGAGEEITAEDNQKFP